MLHTIDRHTKILSWNVGATSVDKILPTCLDEFQLYAGVSGGRGGGGVGGWGVQCTDSPRISESRPDKLPFPYMCPIWVETLANEFNHEFEFSRNLIMIWGHYRRQAYIWNMRCMQWYFQYEPQKIWASPIGITLREQGAFASNVCVPTHTNHPIFWAGRESRSEWGEWSRLGARGLSSCSPPAHSYSRTSHLQDHPPSWSLFFLKTKIARFIFSCTVHILPPPTSEIANSFLALHVNICYH